MIFEDCYFICSMDFKRTLFDTFYQKIGDINDSSASLSKIIFTKSDNLKIEWLHFLTLEGHCEH